jgi:4-diphosphocytidyl-2-C-methyl-D-erythritol kinase
VNVVQAVAPAKINLHLGVGALRPDGFHALTTVYHSVSLFERVTVREADKWLVTMSTADYLPPAEIDQEANLVSVAGRLLADHYGVSLHAEVHIEKNIPIAGGLAGGSADAAAALVALNELWGLGASRSELLELGVQLGSDVPFSLIGGTALGLGRGEIVEPLIDKGSWWWVIVPRTEGLSTPDVFRKFDEMFPDAEPEPTPAGSLIQALQSGQPREMGTAMWNDLEVAACAMMPELTLLLTRGESQPGAIAGVVSGSGPTTVFLCESYQKSLDVAEALRTELGQDVVLTADGPVAGARQVAEAQWPI